MHSDVERKNSDAEEAYTAAIRAYTESNLSEDIKRNAVSFINKFWAEAAVGLDCRSSLAHLRVAADNFPDDPYLRNSLSVSGSLSDVRTATTFRVTFSNGQSK
jgi:hypothetical protein